jgi:hypothetical protein
VGDLHPREAQDDPSCRGECRVPAPVALELRSSPWLVHPSHSTITRSGTMAKSTSKPRMRAWNCAGGSPCAASNLAMARASSLSAGTSSMVAASSAARRAAIPWRPGRAWRTSAAFTERRSTSPSAR